MEGTSFLARCPHFAAAAWAQQLLGQQLLAAVDSYKGHNRKQSATEAHDRKPRCNRGCGSDEQEPVDEEEQSLAAA
ncbi:hypothetical protein OEZ85_009738 [Tetradesmus obliquus]|uniref:Uncharacterized protein n=1 Tax=Tetradesmus obliquus TaxID=3088 RepID=A0ABY8UDU3_TETOB|nr:hypothetical protein OEZ85_009738 [Tetradesmus obliquus]